MESWEKAANQEGERLLSKIMQDLSASKGEKSCFGSFTVFEMVYRVAQQDENPGYLLQCCLLDSEGRAINGRAALTEASLRLMAAIEQEIPRWGVACQYDMARYLLLLVGTEKEECEEVKQRIEEEFLKACPKASIRWRIDKVKPPAFTGQERRRR